MSTQTHSPGYVITARRMAQPFGYHINLMLSSASNTVVAETSHSTHALAKLLYPPRNFYEL